MIKLPRVLAGLSGLLLLTDAYFHATGAGAVRDALNNAEVVTFFAEALPVIWLFFSWHLVVMAMPMLWAAIANPGWIMPAAIFCGVVALGDFFWVYSVAGWFPGTLILLLVVVSLGITAFLLGSANIAKEN